jgi:AcrR family transcriptional regulator
MTKIDAPTAKRGRPPKAKAAGTADTRDLILDAAEDLFSKHGFYGVTIREVAREAGVDTALVHYYFGAKRGLFDAVFLRRAEVWNNERVDAINRYAAETGEAMTLEGLFEAFLRPPFQWSMKGGPGWKHYSALVAQTNANPTFGGETMARYYDPAIRRLIELIKRVLPDAREVDLYWAGCRAGYAGRGTWRAPATIWCGSRRPVSGRSAGPSRPSRRTPPTADGPAGR